MSRLEAREWLADTLGKSGEAANEMKLRPPHEHCERCGNHMPIGATATMVWQKVPVTIYDCFLRMAKGGATLCGGKGGARRDRAQ
jgi:hypothetical protein